AAGVITQVLYTGLGVAAGVTRGAAARRPPVLALAAAATGALLLVTAGPVLARVVATGPGARRWPGLAARLRELQAAIASLAVDRRGLAACGLWHLVAWTAQLGETWLVLRMRGAPVSLVGALWLD